MLTTWILTLSLALAAPRNDEVPPEVLEWIRAHAHAFDPELVERDGDALQNLLPLIDDGRVIALGEGTHGTHEFFLAKDRLVRALAGEARPLALLWESDFVPLLNAERVLRTDGEPVAAALDSLRGAIWNTEEVGELFAWIRARGSADREVRLLGVDIFDLRGALLVAWTALDEADPDAGRALLELLSDILRGDARELLADAPGFDAAFDGSNLAAMRRLAEACALLGDRIDECGGAWEAQMAARVAEQRVRHLLQFMTLLPDLGLERAGDVFEEYSAFQDRAGSDAAALLAFLREHDETCPDSIEVVLGGLVDARRARQEYVASLTPGERQAWRRALLACEARLDVRARRLEVSAGVDATRSARASAAGLVRWIDAVHDLLRIQSEREIVNLRELALADNVERVLAQLGPEARVVYWAHNFHANRARGPEGGPTSGSLLAERLGADFVSVGTLFGRGSFLARDLTTTPQAKPFRYREFVVLDPPPGSLEDALLRIDEPAFALDLRELPADGPVADWFRTPRAMRWIGNQYDAHRAADFFFRTAVTEQFDVVVFFAETTRALSTPSASERYSIEPL